MLSGTSPALIARSAHRRYGVLCCPMARSVRLVWAIGATERSVIRLALGGGRGLTGLGAYWTVLNRTRRCRARCALRGDPHRRARLDVAPPAPGRLPADGPAKFGQQPTVAPEVRRVVPFGTQSLAHLRQVQPAHASRVGPPWRPAPAPVGKAMPWEPAPAAVGYPFGGARIRAGFYPAAGGPDTQAEGDARRPAGGEGTNPAGRPARSGPPGSPRKPRDRPARSAWLPEQPPGKPTPDPRTEDLPGSPCLVGRYLCRLDRGEAAHGRDW